MLKFIPIYEYVLVRKHLHEEALLHPNAAQENPLTGEVMEIGDGYALPDGSLRPLRVKVGDQVLLNKWGGIELERNGNDYLLVRESDILAIIVQC